MSHCALGDIEDERLLSMITKIRLQRGIGLRWVSLIPFDGRRSVTTSIDTKVTDLGHRRLFVCWYSTKKDMRIQGTSAPAYKAPRLSSYVKFLMGNTRHAEATLLLYILPKTWCSQQT